MILDKLTEIENLANGDEENIARLLMLTHDKDEEVRYRAVEAFEEFFPTTPIIDRVKQCLRDEDDLVRTISIELIGDWRQSDSIDDLYSLLNDPSEIVRFAAVISIGQIGREDSISLLENRISNAEASEKACIGMSLYNLGKTEYLNGVLDQLNNDNYLTRCLVANLVSQFIHDRDVEKALPKLKSALLKESTKAAASSIEYAIKNLEDQINI